MSLLRRLGRGVEDEPSGQEPRPPYFAAHHTIPQVYGGETPDLPIKLELPAFDAQALTRPVSRGLPPLMHIALPDPDSLRLNSPFPSPLEAERMAQAEEEPIRFPVAPRAATRPAPLVARVSRAQPSATPAPTAYQEPVYARPAILEQFDPLFAYLIYLALGLGTLFLQDIAMRYVIMALALMVLGATLTLLDARQRPNRITTANIVPGFGFGALIGVPLFLFARPALIASADILYAGIDAAALFQLAAITVPVGETLFFRGVLQNERGFAASVIAAGIASILMYWPAAIGTPVYLGVGAIFSTALAAVYSYIRSRYGMTSAAICQATLNILLIFLPGLLN